MIVFDTRVTVVNYAVTGTDKLGKPKRSVTRRRANVPAQLTQRTSDENPTFVTDRYSALLAPGAQLGPADEVLHNGRTFTVEGSPERKGVPGFSPFDHIAANLRLVAAT